MMYQVLSVLLHALLLSVSHSKLQKLTLINNQQKLFAFAGTHDQLGQADVQS